MYITLCSSIVLHVYACVCMYVRTYTVQCTYSKQNGIVHNALHQHTHEYGGFTLSANTGRLW